MKSEFDIDLNLRTVTHRATGVVFTFSPDPDGSWLGTADRVPTPGSVDAMATLARKAGDAWRNAISSA